MNVAVLGVYIHATYAEHAVHMATGCYSGLKASEGSA